jgi:hypothetical protein
MLHKATRETAADQFFYALLEIDWDKQILITIPDMQWTMKHFWHISDLEAPMMRNKIQIMTKPKVLLLGGLNVVPAKQKICHNFLILMIISCKNTLLLV